MTAAELEADALIEDAAYQARRKAWLADTSAGDAITAAEEELAFAFGDRLATLCASLDAPTPAGNRGRAHRLAVGFTVRQIAEVNLLFRRHGIRLSDLPSPPGGLGPTYREFLDIRTAPAGGPRR